jgi:CMP-N,N'-diacetyllegionaminic acid synthase
MKIWAVVPARGGSKSIPRKNLVRVAGVPLLDYGVRAVQASGQATRIVCSTDDAAIADRARDLGIDVDQRPAHLATDDALVADVLRELLGRAPALPDWVLLVQPTSPFLLPQHVVALVEAAQARADALSAQTVTECVHNHHAWNQRRIGDGLVEFAFAAERTRAQNKQAKPKLFVFGNLVAFRPAALDHPLGVFASPSVAVAVKRPYDFDLDTKEDVALAEALIASGAVSLPHVLSPTPSHQDRP